MRLIAIILMAFAASAASARDADGWRQGFRLAMPGYQYEFPRDHAAHPEFQTEWWYYTGNVATAEGREFGYELTVFRTRLAPIDDPRSASPLFPGQIHAAHFAISDIEGRRHQSWEALGREALGQARSSTEELDIEVRGWTVRMLPGSEAMELHAAAGDAAIDLRLEPLKPLVIHGEDGVHAKGAAPGQASHYLTFSRLATTGTITWEGTEHAVEGLSWMDHEFGSAWLGEEEVGWDWFAIQLESGEDIMAYDIRRRDGTVSPISTGTLVEADGSTAPLPKPDVEIIATGSWTSPDSGATYPMGWIIRIPREDAELVVEARFPEQEMLTEASTGIIYWEGAVAVTGRFRGQPARGKGFVELVGYAEPFNRLKLAED